MQKIKDLLTDDEREALRRVASDDGEAAEPDLSPDEEDDEQNQ